MKPTIGISAGCAGSDSTQAICELVERMGANAYLVCDHTQHDLTEDAKRVTAWIIMGNDWDIDPDCYISRYDNASSKAKAHPKTNSELKSDDGKARAEYEEALVNYIIQGSTPLIGICGGMQRINVVLGGTLHQHLPDLVGDDRHCQRTRGVDPRTAEIPILIEGGTTLSSIASGVSTSFIKDALPDDPIVLYENSIHHQAIDQIATGFRRCCVSDVVCKNTGKSGYIVKGIEVDPKGKYAGKFMLGLQWHPEFCASELGPKIIARLIQEAQFFQYGDI